MRWEIMRKAWGLARRRFPKMARLFVDLPPRFGPSGTCAIFDMDDMSEPLGEISYRIASSLGGLCIVMSVGDKTCRASLVARGSRVGNASAIRVKTSVLPSTSDEEEEPDLDLVRMRYAGSPWLAEQIEALAGNPAIAYNMAAKYGRKFKNRQKVRIMDQTSMEYMELGQVMDYDKKNNLYLVLPDGSERPRAFHEKLLSPNEAGIIKE